jgi:hypothetical protein
MAGVCAFPGSGGIGGSLSGEDRVALVRRVGLAIVNVLRCCCILAVPWVVANCDTGDAQYWGSVLLAILLVMLMAFAVHGLASPAADAIGDAEHGVEDDAVVRYSHVPDTSPGRWVTGRQPMLLRLCSRLGFDH